MDRILAGLWRSHVDAMTRDMRKGKAWGSRYWKGWYGEVVLEAEEVASGGECGATIIDDYCESEEGTNHLTDEAGPKLHDLHDLGLDDVDPVIEYIPEVLQLPKSKY